jgi:hypothetical protein
MTFQPLQVKRDASIRVRADLDDVFPLLCPKREEDWIPGWQCETIWSQSGYNETGAIFRTTKPYDTELYWHTLQYDKAAKVVDFLITAPYKFMLRYRIQLTTESKGSLNLHFTQTFTAISKEGNQLLAQYKTEDFAGRLQALGELIGKYLAGKCISK